VATNDWQQGTMYYGGRLNGTPFWTQPGGPGTLVYPQNQRNVPWPDWPGAGTMTINEIANWVNPGCGHVVKMYDVVQEWDAVEGQAVSLLCCPSCSYVQRAVYNSGTYEGPTDVYNPYTYVVIVG
jgi:hypothetical protein